MTNLILNKAQAEMIYAAMCALNNVGGQVQATMPGNDETSVEVRDVGGAIYVDHNRGSQGLDWELYPTQNEFAKAYGLE